MKTNGNQKNLYLLSLILLITALAIACAWTFTGGRKDAASDAVQTPAPEAVPTPTAYVPQGVETSAAGDAGDIQMVSTVVYYQDNYGYLVPVMCNVKYEDGIAKATLNRLVLTTNSTDPRYQRQIIYLQVKK